MLLDLIGWVELLDLLGGLGVQVEERPLDLVTCDTQLHGGVVTFGCEMKVGITAVITVGSLVIVVVTGMGTVHNSQG